MKTHYTNYFLLLFLFIGFTLSGQVRSKEQIALYNNVYSIDKETDRKLKYFSNKYPGFQEAQLFKVSEGKYILQIIKEKDDKRTTEEYDLDEEGYQSLINSIEKTAEENNIVMGLDRSGRFLKIQSVSSQSLSAGIFLSTAFANSDNFRLSGAAPTLALGGGIVGSIIATRNKSIPLSESMAYASGTYSGALHGLMIGGFLFLNENTDFDNVGTLITGSVTAFSVGESILLQHLSRKHQWSASRSAAIRLGNFSGFTSGLGVGLLLFGDEAESITPYTITSVLGSVGGMLLYDRYFRSKNIPAGNMQAIRIMNPIFTATSTIALGSINDYESSAFLGGLITATSIGGVFLGELLFKDGYVSYTESLYYGLGAYGGGLIATGMSTLLVGENTTPATVASIFAIFSIGSMYAIHRLISDEVGNNPSIGFIEKNSIRFSVNPAAPFINKRFANSNPNMQQSVFSFSMNF